MNTLETKKENSAKNSATGKRIDAIGWALFFIMIGGIGLVPTEQVPQGAWLIGVGLIMLGTNLARYMFNLEIVKFTLVLGLIALALGIIEYYGIKFPVFPVILIMVGLSILFHLLFAKDQIKEK